MNKGTLTSAPVAIVAGFMVFVAVSPFIPGSVYVTSETTYKGKSRTRGS